MAQNSNKIMKFTKAGAAEILRASQKDEAFTNTLKNSISEIFKQIFGVQYWMKVHNVLDIASELIYFSLTTLSLRQTLGEEYTGILQVNHSHRKLPTKLARMIMVVIQCCGSVVIKRYLKKLEMSVENGYLGDYFRPELKKYVRLTIKALQQFPTTFLQAHLVAFYLNGNFFHLSKRLTGIRYVLTRTWMKEDSILNSFKLLGYTLGVHMVLSILHNSYTNITKTVSEDNIIDPKPNVQLASRDTCSLCLDARSSPSLIPCGHLFCWYCIHKSLKSNPLCPLCRHPALPSQVVPLQNFQ